MHSPPAVACARLCFPARLTITNNNNKTTITTHFLFIDYAYFQLSVTLRPKAPTLALHCYFQIGSELLRYASCHQPLQTRNERLTWLPDNSAMVELRALLLQLSEEAPEMLPKPLQLLSRLRNLLRKDHAIIVNRALTGSRIIRTKEVLTK